MREAGTPETYAEAMAEIAFLEFYVGTCWDEIARLRDQVSAAKEAIGIIARMLGEAREEHGAEVVESRTTQMSGDPEGAHVYRLPRLARRARRGAA